MDDQDAQRNIIAEPKGSSTMGFTISMGIASCTGEQASTQDQFSYTLRSADAEMYKAKNQGKNRWCAAGIQDKSKLVQNDA